MPAGDGRGGAHVRGEAGGGGGPVALEAFEDREPDGVRQRPHGLGVGYLQVIETVAGIHGLRVFSQKA